MIDDKKLKREMAYRGDDSLANQPVFFFDGDFRTWGQVEQRAQLNRAFAAHLANHPAHR